MEGKARKCVKCGVTKPASEFYRHPWMKGGRYSKCKACAKRDVMEGTQPTLERRYCAYCGNDITGLNWKRTTCNAPECRKRWQAELRWRRRGYSAGWREGHRKKGEEEVERKKKGDGVRLCRICNDPILNGNWLFCETCHETIKGSEVRFDGDYLFA